MVSTPCLAATSASMDLGAALGLWTILPFAALLLCIALLPLLVPHFWESNRNKGIVAALCALPVALYLPWAHGAAGGHTLLEKGEEYVSFILLLGALYVITGGMHLRGTLRVSAGTNTAILGVGAVLANLVGTTGASMLLIRPILRANAGRSATHVAVFFVFVVSNCGGLLTPLGDPPLFLGFLKGVPFEWTLRLWPQWLVAVGTLLAGFYVLDRRRFRAAPPAPADGPPEPLHLDGAHNGLFLLGVVAVIYAAGSGLGHGGRPWPFGWQEAGMAALALLAYGTTARGHRAANHFSFGPIVEVAVLFAGIFVTMAPALLVLNAWGQGAREVLGAGFGVREPWGYFWTTGALSSFLDNAPTYLTFAATACGAAGVPAEGRYMGDFLALGQASHTLLAAISCGAVFMGANTYIGNGPNFMVKAIAESRGVAMPSFFRYMLTALVVLVPVWILQTLLFFL
jgi:Na+/H+ antiporter NhaD/arsenite permease-like protein